MEFIWEFTKADIPDSPLILPKHLKKRGISWSAALKIPIQPYSPEEKQRWLKQNYDCWYTQTTGIWKDVWAEETDSSYLTALYLTPLYDENSLDVDYELNLWKDSSDSFEIETIITFENFTIYSGKDKVIKMRFPKNSLLLMMNQVESTILVS